ncbi:MAG TPA: serine hydrolase [Bacteroidales bacterium]|nr:serine hydrolase [Bacteroidales bacterium]HPS17311.1 serine hydrolase [Bacteroidales bacterium]
MKILKKILFWFIGIIVIINIVVLITGNSYLYSTFYHFGSSIDDYKFFDNRTIQAGTYIPIPDAKNYNKIKIDTSFRKILEEFNTIAYLVIKNDSVVYEEYWDGYDTNSYSGSFSVAKSIVSLLVGIAIDEGKINSVNQLVSDFIPEYKNGMNAKLTIRDLLTMTSGFDWEESYNNPFSLTAKAYFGNDIPGIIKNLKVIEEPGYRYNYQSSNQLVLAYILQKATGKTLSDYASEKLWKPLGARNSALWSLDRKDGMEKAYCCFNSNARDFSRIGLLALHNGKFNNKQIVSESYINESTKPAELKDGNINEQYGYSWWQAKAFGKQFFYARGIKGQYIIVLPQENMVIVRLGKKIIEHNNRIPAEVIAEFTLTDFEKIK